MNDYNNLANLNWAVERWQAEVKHRPMINVHRRTLDDCWRQCVKRFGGNPDELLGPDHDTLRAQITETEWFDLNNPKKCAGCGTTDNVHRDLGSGGPWRCSSPNCVVF